MELMWTFLILAAVFYAVRIVLDYGGEVQEIEAQIEVFDHRCEHASILIEEERKGKEDASGRIDILQSRVAELQERLTGLKSEKDTEVEQEKRIQLALSKRKVESGRSRKAPSAVMA
jgi:hypothetical protein